MRLCFDVEIHQESREGSPPLELWTIRDGAHLICRRELVYEAMAALASHISPISIMEFHGVGVQGCQACVLKE